MDEQYLAVLLECIYSGSCELEKLPLVLRSEYFYIPRGRVVFHKITGRFTILHGGLKKSELNKIRKFFCISKELTDFDTDFHYTLKPFI